MPGSLRRVDRLAHDVPARELVIQAIYLVSSVFFILGLRGLSGPEKARGGMALASAGREDEAAEIAERSDIRVGDRVLLDGRDVTDAIRSPEASAGASRVAADPGVRAALVAKQQALIADGDWVAEGRDIATVVAPEAAVKVFLTADPAERAARRAAQLGADPHTVLREQALRDERDATEDRTVHEPAPDAVPVDTTGLTLEEVVAQVVTLAVEARELS